MSLSRRDLVKSPLVLAGVSAIGLGMAADVLARPGSARTGETIELWPHPPAGALHPDMTEIVEQSSSDPAYSSRRAKGISGPRMIAFPAAQPNGSASRESNSEVWVKPLSGGARAVALFNRGEHPATISVGWEALGYPMTLKAGIRDLWTHKNLKPAAGRYSATVPGHGVVMLKVQP